MKSSRASDHGPSDNLWKCRDVAPSGNTRRSHVLVSRPSGTSALGRAMFVFSLVPSLGSFLVWAPAAVILAITGSWGKAIILVAWACSWLAQSTISSILFWSDETSACILLPFPLAPRRAVYLRCGRNCARPRFVRRGACINRYPASPHSARALRRSIHMTPRPTIATLAEAVQAGDLAQVRTLLRERPELIDMDMSGGDEHRVLHYAVLRRDRAMVKLLMEAGADARKGIYPHRDATSAVALARDREYHDVLAIIEEEERMRREEMSCPNATISPVQDQINHSICTGDTAEAIRLLQDDGSLIHACDRQGRTPLHIAAREPTTIWSLGFCTGAPVSTSRTSTA